MTRPADLPIRLKFFGMMSLLLVALLIVAGLFTYHRQKAFMIRFAVDNARIFARQLIETREYISAVERGEAERNYSLVPQVVATEVAKRVTHSTKFYVRQVSLRYRNPDNRPDPYETAQLESFQDSPPKEVYAIVKGGGTELFRYLQPMLATPSCLQCHGTFQSAPGFVQQRFPAGHYSYNYRVGQVIGAVSVSIPMHELYAQLGLNFALDMAARGLVFLIVLIVMGMIMNREILRPVKMLSEGIVRVTKTGSFEERLPQRTGDEIGRLIGAFNDMMEELSRKTLQWRESEERYRGLIEMTGSAVVTFLQDGKIVIANHNAETLLGQSKRSLLGESFFDFLEDAALLKGKIAAGSGAPGEGWTGRLRAADGKIKEVEIVIAASKTDREPLITAILTEKE